MNLIRSSTQKILNQNDHRDNDSLGSYTAIDSRKLRMEIMTEDIYPTYKTEIRSNLTQRKVWATLFSIFSTFTVILMGASTVVSFSATQFQNAIYVSYIAGILGVTSLMCKSFSHFCSYQSSTSTHRVNTLLKSIGINDVIPDTMTETQQNLQTGDEESKDSNTNTKITDQTNLHIDTNRNAIEKIAQSITN